MKDTGLTLEDLLVWAFLAWVGFNKATPTTMKLKNKKPCANVFCYFLSHLLPDNLCKISLETILNLPWKIKKNALL